MLLLDVPDDVSAEVGVLGPASQGTFREWSAVRLLSGPQWVEALTAAQAPAAEYIQPGRGPLTGLTRKLGPRGHAAADLCLRDGEDLR